MKPAVIIAIVVALILIAAVLYFAISSSSTSTPSVPVPSTPGTPSPSGSSGSVAAPQASAGTSGHKTFCEQDFASNGISCPSGNLTLNKFQYWRSGGGCKFPQDPNRSFPDCAGKDYAAKMQGMVQGGNLTFAKAINDILGEDPCPNIYKQVDVDYTCR